VALNYVLIVRCIALPSDLQATAWTYDPEDPTRKILMGVQHRSRPLFGVQWHPESICSENGKDIFSNFRDIVLDYWNASSPWNLWTRRRIQINASLPGHIINAGAIAKEAAGATPSSFSGTIGPKKLPYFIKAATIGAGPRPQHVFENFIHRTSRDGEAWLDSAKVRDVHSRNSYLAAAAFSLSYSSESQKVSFFRNGKLLRSEKLDTTYWSWLDNFQTMVIQQNTQAIAPNALEQTAEVGQPILQVGLIGYFGYELKRESLPGYSYSPEQPQEGDPDTDSQLMFANTVLWLDNYTNTWKVVGLVRRGDEDPIASAVGSVENIGLAETEFDDYVERIKDSFLAPASPPHIDPVPLVEFRAIDNETTYGTSIKAAQEAIREGESYELTLTTKFRAESEQDPYALYLSLRSRNPAPYSAFIDFPAHDLSILSSSPERFISIDRNGVAEMKPIKGTVARTTNKEEDKQRAKMLANDIKELAENLMVRYFNNFTMLLG
jgi:para-aminobenzoate synthetase